MVTHFKNTRQRDFTPAVIKFARRSRHRRHGIRAAKLEREHYIRPGFHPWQHDDRTLVSQTLATLTLTIAAEAA